MPRLLCTVTLVSCAVALACHTFHDTEQRLPYSYWGTQGGKQYGAGDNSYAWSWLSRLLPFVEQDNLAARANIPNARLNATGAASQPVPLFLCPSDPAANSVPRTDVGNMNGYPTGRSSYKGVSGANWGDDGDQFQTAPKQLTTDWRNAGTNG